MKKIISSIIVVALVAGVSNTALAQHCTVQKGDSMFKIAERYNILFKDILEHNKHYSNPHLIHPNDKIEFPDFHESGGQQTAETSENDNIKTGNGETTGATESTQAREILNYVNQERQKQGLKPLVLSEKLTSIANTKAQDMANKRYFSHNSPTYGSPFEMLQHFGVNYTAAGENIAQGQKTAREVMDAWLNSSGHRANILNANYTQLGVGYEKNGSHWVQLFIRP